jgi:hypothetical protein
VRPEQVERLVGPTVPGEQEREVLQGQPPVGRRVGAEDGDRLVHASPPVEQLGNAAGRLPPAWGEIRGEHLQGLVPPVLLDEDAHPRLGAEPVTATCLDFHLMEMAVLDEPGDEVGRNPAVVRTGPAVEFSSVHRAHPSPRRTPSAPVGQGDE